MVCITIVTGAYKPTYNWGASHCRYTTQSLNHLSVHLLCHPWITTTHLSCRPIFETFTTGLCGPTGKLMVYIHLFIEYIYLVGGFNPSEKNMSSSLGMIPNIWKHKTHVPNHQPYIYILVFFKNADTIFSSPYIPSDCDDVMWIPLAKYRSIGKLRRWSVGRSEVWIPAW